MKIAKKLINSAFGQAPSKTVLVTMVYELVEKLAEYLPDDIKKEFLENADIKKLLIYDSKLFIDLHC